MPLKPNDITPGIVAYFAVAHLRASAKSLDYQSLPDRDGPFLCVQVDGDRSAWLGLTSRQKSWFWWHLPIPPAHKLGGSPRWRGEYTAVNDLRKPIQGPSRVFVCASQRVDVIPWWLRPKVSDEGLAAIWDAMDAIGAPLLG